MLAEVSVRTSVLELVLDQGEGWKNKHSEEWKKMNVIHVRVEKIVVIADK